MKRYDMHVDRSRERCRFRDFINCRRRNARGCLKWQLRKWVMAIVKRGQKVGVIRSDIPDELIFAWLQALDEASDQWLLVQWKDLDRAAIARISDQTVDAMRRAMVP